MKTKTCSAIFALLLLAAAAAQGANPPAARPGIIAKSHYHDDKSHTESVLDMNVRELEEKTFDANGVLTMRKHYLVNDMGQPTQGNVYDGKNNLVARSMMVFDSFNRVKEMRTANLNGEVFQQVLYEYDAAGKAMKPKVINYDTKAPTFKTATIDFTKSMPNPDQPQATGLQPAPAVQQGNAIQQGAPIYAPGTAPQGAPEEPKKKSFWKRLFGGKDK
jgi:hypothetical protein